MYVYCILMQRCIYTCVDTKSEEQVITDTGKVKSMTCVIF